MVNPRTFIEGSTAAFLQPGATTGQLVVTQSLALGTVTVPTQAMYRISVSMNAPTTTGGFEIAMEVQAGGDTYTLDRRTTMRFDLDSGTVDDPRGAERQAWEHDAEERP